MEQARATGILLVEDEPLIAMAEKITLERSGYSVTTAQSGEVALDIISGGEAIDLVLMDIDLGNGMRGTEAATRILSQRDLPLVFLSSHTEPDVVEQTEDVIRWYGEVLAGCAESRQEIYFPPSQSWFDLSLFPTSEDEFTVVVDNVSRRKKPGYRPLVGLRAAASRSR